MNADRNRCQECGKIINRKEKWNMSDRRYWELKYCSVECSTKNQARSGHPWRQWRAKRELNTL